MRKLFQVLLGLMLAVVLVIPVFAGDTEEVSVAETETDVLADLATYYDFEHRPLSDIMAQFRTEYGLDENNFAMGYYATGTGEAYGFQVDSYRDSGYTYMLPLNIVFYDLEAEGEFAADANYVGTYYLPYLYTYTITDSDIAMGRTMRNYLGDYRDYREVLTRFSQQEYTEEYYSENVLNVRYMMNVLWYIYENAETYPDLLEDLGKAYPGEAFDLLLEDKYNVCHKYSGEDGVYNDCAIIYTTEPFLLTVYSQDIGHAEEMLGALAELLAEYTEYLTVRKAQGLSAYTPLETEAPAVETGTPVSAEAAVTPTPQRNETNNEEEGPVPVWVLILVIILAIALAVFAYMKGLVNGAKMERQRQKKAARRAKMTR